MKKKLRITVLTIMLVPLDPTAIFAQTNFLFTSYLMRDDNVYKAKATHEEWNNTSSLSISHRYTGERYQLQGYYSADISLMQKNQDLNNYAHSFGMAARFDRDDHAITIRGSAKLRDYQEAYAFYNVNSYDLAIDLRYFPDLKNLYSLDLVIGRDTYDEFVELNNSSYRINGRYQRFFQSKLSLSAEASLEVKNYINQSVVNFFGFGGRFNAPRYMEEPVRAAKFSLASNIGKSLSPSLGISLKLGGDRFIGDPIAAYSGGIYYYTENDLFDDPLAYQSRYISLQLTKQFSIGFQGKVGLKVQDKDYAGTPALDVTGNLTGDTRRDTRSEFSLMFLKRFQTGWSVPSRVEVFFNYMYRRNPSNDPYYEFDDHVGLFGFSMGI